MPLLDSLLTAIMRADGDALVLHVGERPYVVTGAGNLELSHTVLTLDFVLPMLAQLLPKEVLEKLAEVGAVEHQLTPSSTMRDAFTVVAARGGDDVWIEVRRKRAVFFGSEAQRAPEPTAVRAVPELSAPSDGASALAAPTTSEPELTESTAAPTADAPIEEVPEPERVAGVYELNPVVDVADAPLAPETAGAWTPIEEPPALETPARPPIPAFTEPAVLSQGLSEPEALSEPEVASKPQMLSEPEVPASLAKSEASTDLAEPAVQEPEVQEPDDVFFLDAAAVQLVELQELGVADIPPAPQPPRAATVGGGTINEVPPPAESLRPIESANVVPLTRVIRVEVAPRGAASKENNVERLLGIAAARSAVQLYLTSQSRPFLRVEGEMRVMDNEATFSTADIDAVVNDLMPESGRELHGRGEPAEWTAEFEGIGRVRCATFRDHRGPGVVFHLTTAHPISAQQLGLTRDIQSLATEPEGLVLVAGPRGGGKSTLIGALVDLINRQHSVSVITIERQIRIVHENRLALVSQREVRGTGADAMGVVRAALRENPDVLVLEDLKSPEIVQLALDAAGTGRLVILAMTAGSTVSALTRVVESFPPPSRKPAQAALAERLRGAVSQVVLRKTGGGRIAARELLLSTSIVTSLIADGQFPQLAAALDGGHQHGMLSLNHVLLALAKSGAVDASEAYRKADNRAALLALLERDGVDTSLLARLA